MDKVVTHGISWVNDIYSAIWIQTTSTLSHLPNLHSIIIHVFKLHKLVTYYSKYL